MPQITNEQITEIKTIIKEILVKINSCCRPLLIECATTTGKPHGGTCNNQ
ncbi:MAG: hypothetical protein LBH74_09965 [Nitrososphaerota archaeon]|nr:hypothetical protein [Nitrososphaerota archaeon]